MKIVLLCMGALKTGPEKALLDQYQARITWPFVIKEFVCRKTGTPEQMKNWEGELLLQALESDSIVIGLDERGKSPTSPEFAKLLDDYRIQSVKTVTFVIGGAEGLSDQVKKRCHHMISFGHMTWPHMLVRGMLAEQIYRAQQIISGHPYHRV
jgi:23S rRNA (pseudouridine1915-N3)-methyltransferase